MKIAFAIVNEAYLGSAFATRESFLKYNLEYEFYIFIHGAVSQKKIFQKNILSVKNYIGELKYNKLNPSYSIFERSCALKTIIASEIADKNPSFTKIIYLDSDLYFVNKLSESNENDCISSIFLTPHSFSPITNVPYLNDLTILSSGIFNAGFFEINNTEESKEILNFLNKYMYNYCTLRRGVYPSIFVDQIYFDIIPVYFEKYKIIKHEGYNLSFHNLHERGLNIVSENWQTDMGTNLIFFHFTGIDFDKKDNCSKYYDFNFYTKYPNLEKLVHEYYDLLNKFSKKSKKTNKYIRFFDKYIFNKT